MKFLLSLLLVALPALGAEVDWIAFVAQSDGSVRALRTVVFTERHRIISEEVSVVTYDAAGKMKKVVKLPKKLFYRDLVAVGGDTYVLANRVQRTESGGRVPVGEAIAGRNELLILRVTESGTVTEHAVDTSARVDDEGVTLAVDEAGRVWIASAQASPSAQQDLFRMTRDLKKVDARFEVPAAEASCAAQFISRLTPANGFLFFAVDVRTPTSGGDTLPFINWYSGVAEGDGNIRWMNERPFESRRRRRESDHLGAAMVGPDGRTLFLVRGSKSKVTVWRRGSAGGEATASVELRHALGTNPIYANRGAVSLVSDGSLVVAGRRASQADVILSILRGPSLELETRVLKDALISE